MDQNRRADLECAKINQNERNEMGWRELGHQNDPNGPKWIFKMSQMHQNQWSEFAKIDQSEQNGPILSKMIQNWQK